MTETKVLTAERIVLIRNLANGLLDLPHVGASALERERYLQNARALAETYMPALLAALEAAQDALEDMREERDARVSGDSYMEVEEERDKALAEMKGERALRQALQERFDRETDSWAKALEEVRAALAKAEGERDQALRERAEISRKHNALLSEADRARALRDATLASGLDVVKRCTDAERKLAEGRADRDQFMRLEEQARARVAELEGALAKADRACQAATTAIRENLPGFTGDIELLVDAQNAIREARPAAPPEQAPRTDDGARPCSECRHSERCRFLLGPSYRAAGPCDWDPSRFQPARPADVGAAPDLARLGDMAAEEARKLAQAGDPLCARDLGGVIPCAHRKSEHRPQCCGNQPGETICPCHLFVSPGAGESEGTR